VYMCGFRTEEGEPRQKVCIWGESSQGLIVFLHQKYEALYITERERK
jgi:hypothetical protein